MINKIREVSGFDFTTDPRKKKAPKNAKFKIVFHKPKPDENTNIPKKFQGVQYFTTKKEAENALEERLNLKKNLKEKKRKAMMNNKLARGNSGNIESLINIQNERSKFYKEKINRATQLLKKGHSVMETQQLVIDQLKLDISEDTRTVLPWMAEARDKILK